MARLWDKGESVDAEVLGFCVGDDHELDQRLVPYDVRASIAHARMLAQGGYLGEDECEAIAAALNELAEENARGVWRIAVEEEDCHTALETRLIEKVGPAGARIHLGRSRNDQVLAALRLYLRDAVVEIAAGAERVAAALDGIADRQGDIALPGYTHLQPAMPSSVALWAGAFAAEIRDDAEGLRQARRRVDKNPLGSAAGYGVPVIDLDREATTAALGFAETQEPVTAVQLSRGKAEAGVVFELALLMQDLGRLAADLCLFASHEFGFVELPEAFTTGSSIMPQKRNPDVFELVRGRSATVAADLAAILALTAKMTSGYHRDLQLVKAPLFRALDSTAETVGVLAHALPPVRFVPERIARSLVDELGAAERAYRLVAERGMPFREAYRTVARELRSADG